MYLRVYLRLATLEAVRALSHYKVRSSLAILGVAVAVAAVVCVVSIGGSGTQAALAELDKLGDNLVWIEAGARSANGVRSGTHGMNTLVESDAAALRAEVPLLTAVSENTDGRVQIVDANGFNWNTQFRGVAPAYLGIRKWTIARGAFFDDDAVARAATVLVIGETVRHQLFGDDTDPIGQTVRIGTSIFEVIGVLAAKGASATGQDQDDTIMMPWTTAMQRIQGKGVTWLDDILCSATSTEAIPHAIAQAQVLLRDRHHIAEGTADDFNIRHPEELLKARLETSRTLQALLLGLGAIALAIGGVGVMNVMLASVAQRTREIGIRLAVGAKPSAIRAQFLGESLAITCAGGAVGVAMSTGVTALVARVLDTPLPTSASTIVLAIVSAAATGVVFGLYPAVRASRLDPIEALRVE